MKRIKLEGDTKNCFVAIKENCSYATWPIQTLLSDALDLSKSFDICNFIGLQERLIL